MTASIDHEMIPVVNPVDGSIVDNAPLFDEDSTLEAFARARKAQAAWTATPVRKRKKIMLRYHDLVLEHRDELMDLIQAENGKNRRSAFEEVLDNAITARHYAFAAGRLLKTRRAKGALPVLTKTEVENVPVGVVGIIAPWNYPLTLSMSDAIPALLAGNAVVIKPDMETPLTALRGAELLREAGLPEDLFIVVPGPGSTVGQTIVAECDYLMFTGSTETGRMLAQQAAERLIGFSGELGGKNPLIVTADADPFAVVRGVREACFSNSGQLCISIERIYVHADVADRFIPAFVQSVNDMVIAGDNSWETDMGCLISKQHTDNVADFVSDAVFHGATVATGGERLTDLGPTFYAPTVLLDVPEEAELYHQEVFGPVVRIEVVDSHEEAIRRANDTEYGLNAAVFGPERTARAIATELEAGTVNINEGYSAAWASVDAPMGGWKSSGVGRRHGDQGLLKYTEPRTIASQRLVPISGPNEMATEKWNNLLSTALKLGRDYLR
ncbi:succinic semialdehyde dehydrogenase [Corynebacterium breve]|uniref:Succinic semialdehyde dehydrogenase n=1 Tax=Corynebacterium breve TaxID=3049799 RepID=A0ABY8VDS7_9CORY|nr:succinic semialdehyde dehydrogenase [Corynebacterium breve]WIM67815.1 succinic semialdehyde dehydrogenase [Corynebacterium breve]